MVPIVDHLCSGRSIAQPLFEDVRQCKIIYFQYFVPFCHMVIVNKSYIMDIKQISTDAVNSLEFACLII